MAGGFLPAAFGFAVRKSRDVASSGTLLFRFLYYSPGAHTELHPAHGRTSPRLVETLTSRLLFPGFFFLQKVGMPGADVHAKSTRDQPVVRSNAVASRLLQPFFFFGRLAR